MKRSANGAVEARDGRKRKRRRRRHGRESLHPGNGAPLQQSDLEPVSSDDDLPQRLVSDQYLEEISDEEPNFHESDSEDDLVIRQCEIVTPLIERYFQYMISIKFAVQVCFVYSVIQSYLLRTGLE